MEYITNERNWEGKRKHVVRKCHSKRHFIDLRVFYVMM